MNDLVSLSVLTGQIQDEYAAGMRCASEMLSHAMNIGERLNRAKSSFPHGTWVAWIDDNFEFSVRTAQDYMRLAEHRKLIDARKTQTSAFISVSDALRLIRDERAQPETSDAQPIELSRPPVRRCSTCGEKIPSDDPHDRCDLCRLAASAAKKEDEGTTGAARETPDPLPWADEGPKPVVSRVPPRKCPRCGYEFWQEEPNG